MDQNHEAPPGRAAPSLRASSLLSPGLGFPGQTASPRQNRGWGLHYHVVTHGDKAGAEIIRVHHACLLLWGQWHQDTGGSEAGGGKAGPGPGRQGTDGQKGRSTCMIGGVRKGKGTQEEIHPRGGERTGRGNSPSTGWRVTRREEDGPRAGSHKRRPRAEVRGRSNWKRSPTRARQGQQERTSPRGPRERGDREIQTEREKRKEKRVISRPGCHP